jgi:hypothetical protein
MSKETKETKLAEKTTRVKRKRLDRAGPLYIDPTHLADGFHYRIVNDSPGEIARRKNMGYEIVQDSTLDVGDNHAAKTSRLGSTVTIETGRSSQSTSVLMRISDDEYQEILEELADAANEKEASMLEGDATKELSHRERGAIYGGVKKD